jgi:hypothetical protein
MQKDIEVENLQIAQQDFLDQGHTEVIHGIMQELSAALNEEFVSRVFSENTGRLVSPWKETHLQVTGTLHGLVANVMNFCYMS